MENSNNKEWVHKSKHLTGSAYIIVSIIISVLFPLILSLCFYLSVFICHTHSRYFRANLATPALTGKLIKAPLPLKTTFCSLFSQRSFCPSHSLSPAPWPLPIPSLPKASLDKPLWTTAMRVSALPSVHTHTMRLQQLDKMPCYGYTQTCLHI